MTEKCKTCRFWRLKYNKSDRKWSLMLADHEYGECDVDTVLMLPTCEREGIYGELHTSSDFGCILHEPK